MIRHSSLVSWGDKALREHFVSSDFPPEHLEAAAHHAHDPPHPPTLLVLTTLSLRTGEHLDKLARRAAAMGARLQLAYYAGAEPSGLVDPLARLEQRARHLRRQHAVPVEVLAQEVRSPRQLLRLTEAATLSCLLDANEAPQHASLGPDLLSLLLREGRGPLWVVNAAQGAAPGGVSCLAKLLPAERGLLRWVRVLAQERALRFVHVIDSAQAPADPRDATEMTVFDHVFRELRVRASAALEALARPLHAQGLSASFDVLCGDFDEQLQRHLREARPSLVVLGHRPRPWSIAAARARVRGMALHGADVLLVPLPRERWWAWLWQRLAPAKPLTPAQTSVSFFHGV